MGNCEFILYPPVRVDGVAGTLGGFHLIKGEHRRSTVQSRFSVGLLTRNGRGFEPQNRSKRLEGLKTGTPCG